MSCYPNGFKGVQPHIGHDQITNILEANMKAFYDWYFLDTMGAWTEVTVPLSGNYGGDFSRLRLVDDPLYTDGQIWEATRKDWVYESGVCYTDITGGTRNPAAPGTLKVSGISYTGSYYIDYPNGRVVLTNPISSSATVQIAYSYRTVQVYKDDDATWWKELQPKSYRVDNTQYLQSSSGLWSLLSVNRIQLPAIIVEAVPRGRSRGYELGSDSLQAYRDIRFTIVAETKSERNNIADIVANQTDKSIYLFDTNTMAYGTGFPLDYRGEKVNNLMYPDWISATGYRYKTSRFENTIITDGQQIHPNLYTAIVQTTIETII